jgi:hypothetical protein
MKSLQYHKIQKYIRSGDLIEWRSNTIIGALIRLRTGRGVNHSSLAIRFESGGELRRHIIEAMTTIELNLMSERIKSHRGKVFWYPLRREFDSRRPAIREWALQQRGKVYDYGGFFKSLFGRVSMDARLFFCSEFVAWGLTVVGIIDCPECAPWPGEFIRFKCYGRGVQII